MYDLNININEIFLVLITFNNLNLIYEIENFYPEKCDIFSLGITYLRIIILLNDNLLKGLNEIINE